MGRRLATSYNTHMTPHGIITYDNSPRRSDYLYRISVKGVIFNDDGDVLVVKEAGRDAWDLPGGGMDHTENIKAAIAREMKEEVNLEGDFSYEVLEIEDPTYVPMHNFWQIRMVFVILPLNMNFSAGEDSDEVAFIDPETLKDSKSPFERYVHYYAQKAKAQ